MDEGKILEAAKVVCKLRDKMATGLLNAADPETAQKYTEAVDHLVGAVLTEEDIALIAKELIAEDPRGKSDKGPLEF